MSNSKSEFYDPEKVREMVKSYGFRIDYMPLFDVWMVNSGKVLIYKSSRTDMWFVGHEWDLMENAVMDPEDSAVDYHLSFYRAVLSAIQIDFSERFSRVKAKFEEFEHVSNRVITSITEM